MNLQENINDYIDRHNTAMRLLSVEQISRANQMFLDCYKREGTLYFCGNGGSASTASHMCGDLLKGASYGLTKKFKAVCLSDNHTNMMAVANDISYDDIFAEPLQNYLKKGDLVIGISGSGNSQNVVKAIEYSNSKGIDSIAFCGYSGGKIKELATSSIHVELHDMEIVEDIHLAIFHAIKQSLIKTLMGTPASMGTVYDQRVRR